MNPRTARRSVLLAGLRDRFQTTVLPIPRPIGPPSECKNRMRGQRWPSFPQLADEGRHVFVGHRGAVTLGRRPFAARGKMGAAMCCPQ